MSAGIQDLWTRQNGDVSLPPDFGSVLISESFSIGGIGAMKSIAEFVQSGISTLSDLQDALQTAMQLEFSTIPPYLCAQWSIETDPSDVNGMVENIVVQEMLHFALAGNMLNAIGRTPGIANAAFIPTYPTNVLPGGVPLELAVGLNPLSPEQLLVFMGIEKPEFPPVALASGTAPATIGAFYDTIAAGFVAVSPAINPQANYVPITEMASPYPPISHPPGGQILTVADALAAIARIKEEGEGSVGDPDQPPDDVTDGQTFAHYYVFKEIYVGQSLEKNAQGNWGFTGPAITLPTAYPFPVDAASPVSSAEFQQDLANLLTTLQTCWTGGQAPNIQLMLALESSGVALIKLGIRPPFIWPDSAPAQTGSGAVHIIPNL